MADLTKARSGETGLYSDIVLQRGPIKEAGVNGDQIDDILEFCVARLREWNFGPMSTRDTSIAITHIEDALLRLKHRTDDRIARGVEGTNQP